MHASANLNSNSEYQSLIFKLQISHFSSSCIAQTNLLPKQVELDLVQSYNRFGYVYVAANLTGVEIAKVSYVKILMYGSLYAFGEG
jgi:hypothetical protein